MRELKEIYILVHDNKRMRSTRYERGHISILAYGNYRKRSSDSYSFIFGFSDSRSESATFESKTLVVWRAATYAQTGII